MAWSGTPAALDPANQVLLDEYQISELVYERLVDLDAKGVPQQALATKWSVSEDGLTWTFELVDNAVFSDGTKLTAKDVEYTFTRLLDPDKKTLGASYFNVIKSVSAVDEHTVSFVLKNPYSDLLYALARSHASIVRSGATAEELAKKPDGTGAFAMSEFTPGTKIVYTKRSDYRDAANVKLDEINQLTIPQAETQTAALAGGQVDLLNLVAPQQVEPLKAINGVKVQSIEGAGFHAIYLNAGDPVLSDVKVRQALALAMDRPSLAKVAWGELAQPAADNTILTSNPFHSKDVKVPEQDIAKAKQLLSEAGHPNGFTMDIYTTNERYGLQEMAVALASQAAKIGVTLNVKTVTNSSLGNDGFRKKPIVTFYFTAGPGGPDAEVSTFYQSNGVSNGGGYEEPYFSDGELDKLIVEGQAESDPAARQDIYNRIQAIITSRGYILIPYTIPNLVAVSDKVSGFEPGTQGYYSLDEISVSK